MKNFELYSKYYDLLYKDKNYEVESNYVYESLKDNTKKLTSILELGCGSGNHANYLITKNLAITGLDRSKEMILEAKSKNLPNFEPKVSDITKFSLNKKYDSVIALFHVISYLENNDDLISCFKCVHDHLNDDGVFLFDFWYTPCVLKLRPEVKIKRIDNLNHRVTRIAEPDIDSVNNVVVVNFDVIIEDLEANKSLRLNEKHRMRHFSIKEIELLCKLTGFELLLKEEFVTKSIPSEETWGICVMLKKI
jgi:SAM-dependent methyltransferase